MAATTGIDLKRYVRDIPDFPRPGILYRDITPLLAAPEAFEAAIGQFVQRYQNEAIDVVVAAEARGFIFAAPLALRLKAGFVPIRKPGKLPFDKHTFRYKLEYGVDTLEMHIDGVSSEGTLDGDGGLEVPIPANATLARIWIADDEESYDVHLGHLDPLNEGAGIRGRLENLGYYPGADDDDDLFAQAVDEFQRDNDLERTGELDDATRDTLSRRYRD